MLIKYGGTSLVPDKLALSTGWLDHALFAIKHEGVRLHYLTAALRLVSAEEMEAEFLRTPNGTFVRKLCLLWEADHQRSLPAVDPQPVAAAYLPMFDPAANVTGASRRNARWLVDVAFCPVVRKTDAVLQGLQHDVLADAKAFATSIGPQMLERALSWAYLSDTEGSFAIEGETPTKDKASRFAALLKRAYDPRPLTEEYLVELQNATVTNPFDRAAQFRNEQNRLQGNAVGAAGVTYVLPLPELWVELTEQLMVLCNQRPQGLDPVVYAGLVSFAFVFLPPFMDGNGHLPRFLIHHCLGQSGGLPAGFLLPVSVAMKSAKNSIGRR